MLQQTLNNNTQTINAIQARTASYLRAAAYYETDDVDAAERILKLTPSSTGSSAAATVDDEEVDKVIAYGCIKYKRGQYVDAEKCFTNALAAIGYAPDVAHNLALTLFAQNRLLECQKVVDEIIENGIRTHPELSVGSGRGAMEAAVTRSGSSGAAAAASTILSVGNTLELKETALIEAFNLKFAIEYTLKNTSLARAALADMPPRDETELDAVTLCNVALMEMDVNPTAGFQKLNYLLSHPPFPPCTYRNLLLLYLRFDKHDLAADTMAENPTLRGGFGGAAVGGGAADNNAGSGGDTAALYDLFDGISLIALTSCRVFSTLASAVKATHRWPQTTDEGHTGCTHQW